MASRAAKERCDAGFGVNNTGLAVYLDFADAIQRMGRDVVEQKYGNLFQMYEKIVNDNPYETPMMIYPAIHYTMGGIWVDYELMTSYRGSLQLEKPFSDHGANRLGASALMRVGRWLYCFLYDTELFGRPDSGASFWYRSARVQGRRGSHSKADPASDERQRDSCR